MFNKKIKNSMLLKASNVAYKKGYEEGYIEGWSDYRKILNGDSNSDEYFHFPKSEEPFTYECQERGIGHNEQN